MSNLKLPTVLLIVVGIAIMTQPVWLSALCTDKSMLEFIEYANPEHMAWELHQDKWLVNKDNISIYIAEGKDKIGIAMDVYAAANENNFSGACKYKLWDKIKYSVQLERELNRMLMVP